MKWLAIAFLSIYSYLCFPLSSSSPTSFLDFLRLIISYIIGLLGIAHIKIHYSYNVMHVLCRPCRPWGGEFAPVYRVVIILYSYIPPMQVAAGYILALYISGHIKPLQIYRICLLTAMKKSARYKFSRYKFSRS